MYFIIKIESFKFLLIKKRNFIINRPPPPQKKKSKKMFYYKLGLIHKTQAEPSSSHENKKGKLIRLHDWLRSTGSLWFKSKA